MLTERAAALARHGQPAETLLVITNRAAAELRGRLAVLLGSDAERMTVGTYRAVCHRLLRADAERASRGPALLDLRRPVQPRATRYPIKAAAALLSRRRFVYAVARTTSASRRS